MKSSYTRGADGRKYCSGFLMYTTQKEIRQAFWRDHPGMTPHQIVDYRSDGKMHTTDTRCAFVDYVDALARSGTISEALAQRATL